MGNSLNLSETLIIALGVLTVIFAVLVLYAISMVSKLSQETMQRKIMYKTLLIATMLQLTTLQRFLMIIMMRKIDW